MRLRFLPAGVLSAGVLIAGIACVATGTVFAYTTQPAAHTVEAQTEPPADVAEALGNLRQAGLPLSFLGGGVTQLTDGSGELDAGAHRLADGLTQARAGGRRLSDGLGRLQGGVGRLGDGATQVSGGVDEVVQRLGAFGEIQGSVTGRLTRLADTLAAQPGPVAQGAAGDLRTLVDTLNTEGLGPDTLDRLAQLQDGARRLAYELAAPDAEFVAGMAQAADGADQLRDGLALLDDGGGALTDGTGRLTDGVAPVSGIVERIAANVKSATGTLASAEAAGTTQTEVVTGDRAWWPYALIAVGAALLVALAVRGAVPPRGPGAPQHAIG